MHFPKSQFLSLISTCAWGDATEMEMLTGILGGSNAGGRTTTLGQTLPFRVSPGVSPIQTSPPHLEGGALIKLPIVYEDGVEFSVEETKSFMQDLLFHGKLLFCLSHNPMLPFGGLFFPYIWIPQKPD